MSVETSLASEYAVIPLVGTGILTSWFTVFSSSDPLNRMIDNVPGPSVESIHESSGRASPEATRATMRVGAIPY